MNSILDQDIMYLSGVGPKRKELLNKELNLHTWGDLLEYYPYKYVDRSRVYSISELSGDMPFVQIKGHILSFEEFAMGARKKRIIAHFTDGSGIVDIVWFNGTKYVYNTYKVNEEYIVFGKPTIYGGRFQFAH
ncbi:MAG: ATP-dependent DNA helicase RecG, partial [Prevotella sp.]|nr:ATP-dependent DNA helicase RecG [Prevotella sp.]